jgi:site-specific DNA-methyltransferase (adenine-specific)
MRIINDDFREYVVDVEPGHYDTVFADPPDNLGLKYDHYDDSVPPIYYYHGLIAPILWEGMRIAKVVWLSYYWRHDLEIKNLTRNVIRSYKPTWQCKTFIWRYTFGQHNTNDCGSGFRYLLRLSSPTWKPCVQGIRIPSERQAIGDKRADLRGRVPDDVWDFDTDCIWTEFPRVVGNAAERREWHPTQHPEGLIERIFRLSGSERILDCFLGTGTTLRVAKRLGIEADGCEIDPNYCRRIANELGGRIERQFIED